FDTVTLEFTRIVIAVQVMAAGVSLPRSYMVKERRSLFMMIVPLMIMMWLTSALLIWGMIPDLDFVEAMVLAACVTPTDPVLSNSVVKGRFAEKHVPPRIRYLLSAESGINDGMGLPFLFLGLYLMREKSVGTAFGKWFYMVWAYQILLSIVLGGLIGAAARKLVKGAKNRNLIDKESFLVFSIALTLAVVGCVAILASDDLLACFIAGNIFAWDDWFSNEIAEAHIQETIDMLLNLACFVYIGSSIPFSSFHDATLQLSIWRLVVLAVLILLLRRLPYVMMFKKMIPALATYREAAFAGWFGPIGVGAVYFSKVTASMTDPNNLGDNPHNVDRLLRVRSVIFPVVMFMVLSSVFIHGITVPLLHLQYKYTRTWSRKREESSHVVTRLPHINIGDEIILRPPTINGSNGYMEGDGGDPQRSIGYDNQRSLNQRSSLSFGSNPPGHGGFAIAGVPDLSRTSTSSNHHHNGHNGHGTRTLEDVVQEMKEAARSKGIRHPNHTPAAAAAGNNSGGGGGGGFLPLSFDNGTEPSFAESTIVQLGDAISMDSSHRSTSPFYRGRNGASENNNNEHAQEYIESLRESHPASQGLHVRPSDVRSNSASGSSGNSSTTVLAPLPSTPSDTDSVHNDQARPSASEFHEIEREEDNGVVREESHEIDERGREQIERVLDDEYRQQPQSDPDHNHPRGSTSSRPSFESGPSIAGYGSGSGSGSQEASLRPGVASEDPELGGNGDGDDGVAVAVDQQGSSSSGSSSSRLHRQLGDIFKSLKRDRDSKSIG
ncbi:hypothetical protein BGZ68_000269, partial [Mortierella alpina]